MSCNSSVNNNRKKHTDQLFLKFAAFYGHAWRSQFKTEHFLEYAKKVWGEALSIFTESVIDKAMLNCREFYELPPTLTQMINSCKQMRKQAEIHNFVRKTVVTINRNVALAHLKQCKEILTH